MKRFYTVLTGLVLITACTKKMGVDTPNMSISINTASSTAASNMLADTFVYKLGDTTRFIFTGTTGNLIVYTGDSTHNYDNKDRSAVLGTATLSFTSNASANIAQSNTLKLLATNKLPGLDSASITSATWTDITSRAALSTNATSVNSGVVTLSDLANGANDSLFVAFKYSGVTGTVQPTWTITNFIINNVLPDVTYNLSTLATDANYWTKIRVAPNTSPIWVASATSLILTGGAATNPNNVGWVISKPLYIGRVIPDLSIPLININGYTNNASATSYFYKYAKTGTYKVVFMAFNNTLAEQKSVFKQFYVKVQ